MKAPVEWTNDCGGKMDYDGFFVSVGTRYWPRGGGFLTGTITPEGEYTNIQGNESRSEVRPSANSAILLNSKDVVLPVTLVEQEFEGETKEEVQRQVEIWVQSQYDKIAELLMSHFGVKA